MWNFFKNSYSKEIKNEHVASYKRLPIARPNVGIMEWKTIADNLEILFDGVTAKYLANLLIHNWHYEYEYLFKYFAVATEQYSNVFERRRRRWQPSKVQSSSANAIVDVNIIYLWLVFAASVTKGPRRHSFIRFTKNYYFLETDSPSEAFIQF